MSGLGIGDSIRSILGRPAPDSVVDGEAGSSGVGDGTVSPDLTALKREARKGGKRAAKATPDDALAAAQAQAAIDELYSAENWEEIAGLYFETRYALTGFDGFRLSEKSKRVLSVSLASTMKTLAIMDPKYVALTIFAINFGGLIAQKEMTYAAVVKRTKAARLADEARRGGAHIEQLQPGNL